MVRMGIIGLGGMGRGHLSNCEQMMKDGEGLQVVALCDIAPEKFGKVEKTLNLPGMEQDSYRFDAYHLYTSAEEMLEREKLDFVLIAAPTYEHSRLACMVMERGLHCLSEKPMALTLDACKEMIACAERNRVRLMIGQCLRFSGPYNALKEYMVGGALGVPLGGFYRRGGSRPAPAWYFRRELGGGGLFDQHIHDVDMVQYLYGMPEAVSTVGRVCVPGSGYDMCATNYLYGGRLAVSSENSWYSAERGFGRSFRADFEEGTAILDYRDFRVVRRDSGEVITPAHDTRSPHANEVRYFVNLIENGGENTVNPPKDSMQTIRLALAEMHSADLLGQPVAL